MNVAWWMKDGEDMEYEALESCGESWVQFKFESRDFLAVAAMGFDSWMYEGAFQEDFANKGRTWQELDVAFTKPYVRYAFKLQYFMSYNDQDFRTLYWDVTVIR